MLLPSRFRGSRPRVMLGLACLVLANATHWFVRPLDDFHRGLDDGAFGALLGMAIALIALGLRQRRACGHAPAD